MIWKVLLFNLKQINALLLLLVVGKIDFVKMKYDKVKQEQLKEKEKAQNHRKERQQESELKRQQQKQKQQQSGREVIPSNNIYKAMKEQLAQKYKNYSAQKLFLRVMDLEIENKKLSNRLIDLQPFKQKKLREPNRAKAARLFEQFQMRKFALKICYLGQMYDGMALQQQTKNTIEQYLFKCMYTLNLIPTETPGADYTRAGRTDKGVSAMGNVVALNLRTKLKNQSQYQQLERDSNLIISDSQIVKQQSNKQYHLNYCQMLNAILPDDIRIIGAQEVNQEFNARYWCKQRSYKYFFVKNTLNIERMQSAIKDFEGVYNFINFCKINLCNTVNFEREIKKAEIVKVQLEEKEEFQQDDRCHVYYFHFVGNSFLWHQIRFMSSVLFMVGQGSEPETIVRDLLNVQKYPRKPNYTMAPEYPLILQDCLYEGLIFRPEPQIIYRFYNTFHEMVCKKTIEKTLMVNCMHLARRDLLKSSQITDELFNKEVLNSYCRLNKPNKKSMELHKASGRGLQEAIKSLKGKKKELYQKKAQKQKQYEEKIREANQMNEEKSNKERKV